MSMRVIGVSVLCVIALALLGGSARARGPIGHRCRRGQPHLVAADARAQIYLAKQSIFSGHQLLREFPVYRACVFGSARTFDLGEADKVCSPGGCATSVDHPTLAGTVVAFERSSTRSSESGEGGSAEWLVIVRDLRSERVLRTVPTGTEGEPVPQFVGAGPTTAIVVKPDGAVGWIVDTDRQGEHDRYEVWAADSSGTRNLATGSTVNPKSLALAGSTLSWTRGGKRVSATLN